ncbi:hypothetical protein LP419_26580 [Massilia sp. H-1]|nr:hypothetical protein LP419_26580 [Massilia sp. H-1]
MRSRHAALFGGSGHYQYGARETMLAVRAYVQTDPATPPHGRRGMRLSISNIAWELADDEAVAALLRARSIDAIDIAPGKYFPDPAAATDADIARAQLVAGARDRDRRHAGAAVRHDRPEPVRTGPGTGRHAGPPGRRLPHRRRPGRHPHRVRIAEEPRPRRSERRASPASGAALLRAWARLPSLRRDRLPGTRTRPATAPIS